jgi:hypothetical protein
VFTLRTRDEQFDNGVGKVAVSLNANAAARADKHKNLELVW